MSTLRFALSLPRCILVLLVLLQMTSFRLQAQDLKAGERLHWYRGNMHTHSLWSDGDDYPEMIASWYRERGYQFLVFTDHNVLHNKERWIDVEKNKGGKDAFKKLEAKFTSDWIDTREKDGRQEVRLKNFDEVFDRLAVPQEYLLIQGEEITDKYKNLPVHMCATNVDELLPPLGGESITEVIQRNVEAAQARRERTGVKTLVHLNHPNFGYAVTARQLMRVAGERFFEVYNGHPGVHNSGDSVHASTEKIWDIVNTWRLAKLDLPLMYGLATDDGHAYHRKPGDGGSQPGRGWVMVLASELTPDALVTAIESGNFYSSSGVSLERIKADGRTLSIEIRPQEGLTYRTDFIGTFKGFDDSSDPAALAPELEDEFTRRYSKDVGRVLKSVEGVTASYQCSGNEIYVRAVVYSSQKHPNPSEPGEFERAWVQPMVPGRN
ncbi:MAG: hypothetical protein R3C20_02370 [Planctomycetaceae bacterium]